MRKRSKEELQHYLLVALLVLVMLAAFVLFMEKGLSWLGITLRFIGLLLSPFCIAWLVAVITRPLTNWFVNKLHFPRTLAVLLIILLLLVLVTSMVWLVIAVLSDVMSTVAKYVGNIEFYANDLINYIGNLAERLGLDISSLDSYFAAIRDKVESWAMQGVSVLLNVAKGTPATLILVLVMLVSTFYWCREELHIRDVGLRLLPKSQREKYRRMYDNISRVLGGYVRAQALLVLISLVICIVGFTIIGAQSPLAFGFFAGVMDIIPVLGPGTLIVPWAVWSLATGKYGFGVGLLVIYAIVSITRYILEPKIVGDRVGLHPLLALAAIFIGMRIFGLLGLILGPIVMALLVTLYRSRPQFMSDFSHKKVNDTSKAEQNESPSSSSTADAPTTKNEETPPDIQ